MDSKNYLQFPLIFFILILFYFLNFNEASSSQQLNKRKIDICCTWGTELKDSILTYYIKKSGSSGNNDLERIVNFAFSEWEKSLSDIQFKKAKDGDSADIEIKFDKGNVDKEGGQAVIYFDRKGFIDQVEISVSKTSNEIELDKITLEHITKHEIGHALGLGHSQFPDSLMSPIVNETVTKISVCEIDAVKDANNWKFIENDKKPKMIEQSVYICSN